jgi:hypothetical protein
MGFQMDTKQKIIIFVLTLGSLFCGLSPGIYWLIFSRGIQAPQLPHASGRTEHFPEYLIPEC